MVRLALLYVTEACTFLYISLATLDRFIKQKHHGQSIFLIQ